MALETGTFLDDLVITNPAGTDQKSEGDDHLRLIKTVLKNTFPDATAAFRFEKTLAQTSAYTVVAADARTLITADASTAAFTITLIAAATAGDGFVIEVKKTDSSANAVTVDGNGAETIDGALTFILASQYENVKLICDGSNWHVLSLGDPDIVKSNVVKEMTRYKGFDQATLTDAATVTWNGDTQQCATVTLAGNRTLAEMTNRKAGGTYLLRIVQDGTGGRTLAFAADYHFSGGGDPTLSTAVAAVDLLTCYFDGTNMLCAISLDIKA